MLPIQKIISGGQTGVDRAALDVALALGIPCGGHCPKGRRAEDGPLAARYPLTETESEEYDERTELNVKEGDGTLILNTGPELAGGTLRTKELAEQYGKPVLIVDMDGETQPLKPWLKENEIKVLNVAGPRQLPETQPYEKAIKYLFNALMPQ